MQYQAILKMCLRLTTLQQIIGCEEPYEADEFIEPMIAFYPHIVSLSSQYAPHSHTNSFTAHTDPNLPWHKDQGAPRWFLDIVNGLSLHYQSTDAVAFSESFNDYFVLKV
jgi:hypothetical protein